MIEIFSYFSETKDLSFHVNCPLINMKGQTLFVFEKCEQINMSSATFVINIFYFCDKHIFRFMKYLWIHTIIVWSMKLCINTNISKVFGWQT